MKIHMVTHFYIPEHRSGAEVMAHHMLQYLVECGHEVVVSATDQARPFVIDGVRVQPGQPRDERADVYVSQLKNADATRKLAKMRRKPFVLLAHSHHPWVKKQVVAGPDAVVYNTDWLRAEFHRTVPQARKQPSLVVHPPVLKHLHTTEPGEAVTLVNPLPEKGSKLFYDLVKLMPDQEFLVVEGGYQREQQRFEDWPNVSRMSQTGDMRQVWSRTKVLLMPSQYESYGLCAVEACCSGIPTLHTPTVGLMEALGAAANPMTGTVQEWKTNLEEILEYWDGVSARARVRAQQLNPFPELESWEKMLASLL